MSSAAIRSFLALEIEPPLRAEVTRLGERLCAALPAARRGVAWVAGPTVHLTLVFLGAVEPTALEALAPRLEEVARAHLPFDLATASPGLFPNPRHPRVLWVGLAEPREPLLALQQEVAAACRALSLGDETYAYHPHLTAGRVRERAERKLVGELAPAWLALPVRPQAQRVSGFSLMRSENLPGGSVYTRLRAFPLGG
jgi:2'-5' RNA ligase